MFDDQVVALLKIWVLRCLKNIPAMCEARLPYFSLVADWVGTYLLRVSALHI